MYVNKVRFLTIILTGMLLPVVICYSMNSANGDGQEEKTVTPLKNRCAEQAAHIKKLREREKSMISGSEPVKLVLKARNTSRTSTAERPVFPVVLPAPKAVVINKLLTSFLLQFNQNVYVPGTLLAQQDSGEGDSGAIAQLGNDGSGD